MAGIGGVGCDMVQGNVRSLKERVEIWQVPGINGYGAQLTGLGDSDAVFTGVEFDSHANIITWIAAIEALQGTVCSIVDDQGVTHSNVLITDVGRGQRTARVNHDSRGDTRGQIKVKGLPV